MSAISALKGYRTQFLYSLDRVLIEYKNNYIFRPEGQFEDLDILDEVYNYREVIQIKNVASTLLFSDLFSKKTSFFSRSLKVLEMNEEAVIKLISFSVVSDEITDKNKLGKKLKGKGFNDQEIIKIIQNFSIEVVSEGDLHNDILKELKTLSLFTNVEVALELLVYWLYTAGERQLEINSKELIMRLERIGKFISEKTAFNNQFGNTIIPLSNKTIDDDDFKVYSEGFYYGVSAKYEHILSNLDVLRDNKLASIHNAFSSHNIVFIHGASGQGKSTLSYRYLHDFSETNTVYELKISQNLNEVYEVINTLEALSKGLDFPIQYILILNHKTYIGMK